MKVKIGPYKNWFGVYQLCDLLQHVGVSKDKCHELGGKMPQWSVDFFEWIHSKKRRSVKIHIDDYDVWSVDATLAYIIVPMLKKLKEVKHGSPYVDDCDVPEHLKSTAAPAVNTDNGDIDDNFHKRWEWVLDEMIWAWEQLHTDTDWEAQYHSGVHDTQWVESDTLYNGETTYKMIKGPNDTRKFDYDGYKAHSDRITRGTTLFGKYTQNLWD